jgi:uncharacterized protein
VPVFLLDVNVLIALLWSTHEHHLHVQHWFQANRSLQWATCPFTQIAFVRILSNPAFSRDATSPNEAEDLLAANTSHHNHRFWPDDIDFATANKLLRKRIVGHRQVSDAYLLGLAVHHKGRLATMDASIQALLEDDRSKAEWIARI